MFLIQLSLNTTTMQHVQVIHNPGAGDEKHSKEQIISLLTENGYRISYLNTKEDDWKKFNTTADIILVAGGDGTVRKVARQILKGMVMDKPAKLALLPLGTANNVSRSLGLTSDIEHGIKSWNRNGNKFFDVGRIFGVPDAKFFLESFGFGVFPYMMKKSQDLPEDTSATLEEKIRKATKFLRDLSMNYPPVDCTISIDDQEFSGSYLLAEVLNTPSIGPKLDISPGSDPGDGLFEVTVVPGEDKEKFLAYLADKMEGKDFDYSFDTKRGRNIRINWNGTHAHVDDQFVNWKTSYEANIHLKDGLLNFLVPS